MKFVVVFDTLGNNQADFDIDLYNFIHYKIKSEQRRKNICERSPTSQNQSLQFFSKIIFEDFQPSFPLFQTFDWVFSRFFNFPSNFARKLHTS